MSYDFYFSQEWALKHNKSLWKDKNYDEEDDMAIKELFDQLDEDHSNTIEYNELLKMMKNLNIRPEGSRLPKYFGFVGEHPKNSLSFEEFKGLVSSNKYKHRLYGDVESVNNINELIEFVNSLRRYNLKMSLSTTDNSQKSVDIYKQLFELPVYYVGMNTVNEGKESNNMDIWKKMKKAMRELHTVNEKVNKSKHNNNIGVYQHRRSKISCGDNKINNRRISSYDIRNEQERINRLVMTLPAIKTEKKKDVKEKPETPSYYTPIPPIITSPLSHKNLSLRKKRSVIIKPMTSHRRSSQFYEINEDGEILPKYSPVKCAFK